MMKKAISILIAMALSATMVMPIMAEEEVTLVAEQTETVTVDETATDDETPAVDETATDESKSTNFVLVMQIDNPNMTVNGVQTEIDPGEGTVPVIQDERTLVPVRAIVEAMGGTVTWDGDTQTATLVLGEDTIKLTIGSTTAYLNDVASTLDVTPIIINERTMLPIRFIAESFKFEVAWDGDTQTIFIVKEIAVAEDTEETSEEVAPTEETTEETVADETTEEATAEDTEETTPVEEETTEEETAETDEK